ncbi:MAG: SusC/RagA family TonB-linked outer membrane protein [Bacteroidales bacterium]|nr:SusC/RagA family TonB-linked outer membrane protein [Bacteroidales bacterium]MBR1783700.1 SusC/RagA family TonB-linked outer membrane protein [Bacteroidales bacterium]
MNIGAFVKGTLLALIIPFSATSVLWAQNPPAKLTVQGKITDTEGEPLPGANVMVKGTRQGIAADENGNYVLTFTPPSQGKASVLQFSFIGMQSEDYTVRSSTTLNVKLKSDTALDAVVVNGFYDQKKETFTGAATVISGEELVKASPTNLVAGIAAMTPGMVMVENNALGSDPNAIPSILIRGANTLITNESEEGVNNPLIVLDGVEISMEELYDLDIFDIERVDVLKDASATILYGEKGSNGVIVIERKRIGNEKVKLSYNFVPKFSYPDLSSFNLTNAQQKLEFERLAGLYESADGSLDQAYDYKLQNVRRGVNTDWLSAPLRIPFSHNHSLSLTSRGEKLDFSANAHFNDTYGVMKGDNRRGYGINFTINYHLRDKLTLSYKNNFSLTDSKASPYGSFSEYAKMNPYEPIYDEDGELRKYIPFNPFSSSTTLVVNPLYDATTSSFSTNRSMSDNNSLSLRYNITKAFYLTSQGNLSLSWGNNERYVSPAEGRELMTTEITKRGSYTFSSHNNMSASGKVVLNYGKSLDSKGSMFRVSAGADVKYNRNRSSGATAEGFLKDNLSDIKFALAYANGRPSGTDNISTSVGFFANGNISFRNRYFGDVSYRSSGSSKFGSANSFAPFWAAGLGWNVHNEPFAKNWDWLNSLVFRVSSGYTGNVSFSYYQAKTIYEYKSDNLYYTGIGALPKQMGNPDLKWQRTLNNNIGLTAAFLDNRINLSLDYYINTTHDMVMSIDLPPSVGTTSMSVNFGQLTNQGVDLAISAQIIRTTDWFWSTTLNGGHVMDRIEHIAESMKNTEVDNAESALKPKILFREGGSQFDIYAMRSAGIDPATGQEIFIRKNGEYTYRYDANERVAVGNTNPILQGSWMNTIRYKGLSVSISTSYTFGGDVYNETLQQKVEKVDPQFNVDARAFTDRWKQPGDQSRYLAIQSKETAHYSERFVEKKNELYISNIQVTYELPTSWISRIGLRRLTVGFGLSDVGRISTVRYERGTSYPYCRSINLIFRPTF